MAGNTFPQTKTLSKFDKVQQPAEVAAALLKMLLELPGGVMGSAEVFNQIYHALRASHDGRTTGSISPNAALVRFVAKVVAEVGDGLQFHLICTIFGLVYGLCQSDTDVKVVSKAFGPVILSDKVIEICLEDGEIALKRRIGGFRERCRKILRSYSRASLASRRLEVCEYVVAELIKMWHLVLSAMTEFVGGKLQTQGVLGS